MSGAVFARTASTTARALARLHCTPPSLQSLDATLAVALVLAKDVNVARACGHDDVHHRAARSRRAQLDLLDVVHGETAFGELTLKRRPVAWKKTVRHVGSSALGAVHRRPAEHAASVLDVAVAVAQVGDDVEDVEAHRRRRLDARLDHPGDVALAAPHGGVARGRRSILGLHAADAQADDRHLVRVGVVTRERLAPDLAGAVEPARPP